MLTFVANFSIPTMGKLGSYKLALKSLQAGIQQFSYRLDEHFFSAIGESDVLSVRLDAQVNVNVKHDGLYEIEFRISGEVGVPCDRCLDEVNLPIDAHYTLTVKEGQEYDDSADSTLVIPQQWNTLDIAPLMRDTVLVSLPIRHVHTTGECNEDMAQVLSRHQATIADDEQMYDLDGEAEETANDHDEPTAIDPRWDALKKLQEKTKQ